MSPASGSVVYLAAQAVGYALPFQFQFVPPFVAVFSVARTHQIRPAGPARACHRCPVR
jgi:hypothetical protein